MQSALRDALALQPKRAQLLRSRNIMLELRPTCEHCNQALPNCGGGFVPRPIDPASTKIKHRSVDPAAHAKFSAPIKNIPPEKR
jgi:hypothetical protein